MTADALSSIPPRGPVALVDLVGANTPESHRAFVANVSQLAQEAGGRRVLANEAIVPMMWIGKTSPVFSTADTSCSDN
jgi:hypothetical protein